MKAPVRLPVFPRIPPRELTPEEEARIAERLRKLPSGIRVDADSQRRLMLRLGSPAKRAALGGPLTALVFAGSGAIFVFGMAAMFEELTGRLPTSRWLSPRAAGITAAVAGLAGGILGAVVQYRHQRERNRVAIERIKESPLEAMPYGHPIPLWDIGRPYWQEFWEKASFNEMGRAPDGDPALARPLEP